MRLVPIAALFCVACAAESPAPRPAAAATAPAPAAAPAAAGKLDFEDASGATRL